MKTKLKKLTSVCLAVIMILGVLTVAPVTTSAAEETGESVSVKSGDFEYELYDDDTLSITGYSGNAANLTIPSEIDGYTVTQIGGSAFYGNTSLTSVTIPDTVTYIGSETFARTALSSVTIPDSVTGIDYSAFYDCKNLKSVTIPVSVRSIGDYAFGYVYDDKVSDYVKADGFTISGYTNSRADLYASDNGFKFVSLGEVSPFVYEVNYDDGISITGYNGKESNLTIPSAIDGYKVTEIVWEAFYGNTRLTSVTIPDGVTNISNYAFQDCINLTSVTIPDSVTHIGYNAFESTALSSIAIPASVTYIGEYAFGYIYDYDEYEHVKADGFTISGYTNSSADLYARDNGFKFVSLGEVSPFVYEVNYDDIITITGYNGSEANLTIPSTIDGYTVTEIGDEAFYGNTRLKSVTIPDTVTYIDGYAFQDCENLASVIIPDSVTYIGYYAFANTALSSIAIPASVTSIREYAFGYVYDDKVSDYVKAGGFKIYGYTNSEAEVYAKENGFKFVSLGTVSPFGYDVLEDGTASINKYRGSETNLTIPSTIDGYTVTEIDWEAFYGNTRLKSVTIPDTVTSIGGSSFRDCVNLTSVTIPDSVTYIGYNAFENTALSGINIPVSVINIGEYAFADCQNLKNVTIPASVTYIGEYAFGYIYDYDEDEYVKVDGFTISGYTNSRADLYASDNGFKFVSLGEVSPFIYEVYDDDDTISIIGYNGKETNLTIPSAIDGYTVEKIGWNAFSDNLRLKSVTIPDTVTYIDGYAFQDCENLTSVTIPDGVRYIGYRTFENTALSSITIPDSVTNIAGNAFADCKNLKSVTIPSSVQSIGEYAFGYVYENNAYEAIDGFTISGYTNSRAEVYASDNGFKFVSLGEVSPFMYEMYDDDTISITRYNGKETNLNIPSEIDGYTVVEIGWNAFYGNTRLKSVTIPDTVTYIGGHAFQDCKNLASATIPDSVTRIGYDAFENTALSSITIPSSVTIIEDYAFADCANLKSVTIPASVTYIGEYAFGYIYDYDEYEYVKADGFTISGYAGSDAERYANENGFKFVPISEYTDAESKITVLTGTDAELKVAEITDTDEIEKVNFKLENEKVTSLYDISFVKDDTTVQPDGTATVKIPCTNENSKVYRVETDGSLTDMNAVYDNGYMVFTTNHFSFYVLTEKNDDVLLGDVNGDGKISIDDATAIQKYLANMLEFTDEQAEVADVNMDGDITIDDVTLVQKYLAGLAEI